MKVDWYIDKQPINLHSFQSMYRKGMTMSKGVGTKIETVSGDLIDFANPTTNVYNIEDIACGLSKMCRFSGQIEKFYSVAEHSILMSHMVAPEFAMEALLHDRTEAYMGDITTPLKRLIPDYMRIEQEMYEASALQFGVPIVMSPEVREADARMLVTEKKWLANSKQEHIWQFATDIEPYDNLSLLNLDCLTVQLLFVHRYNELLDAHNRKGKQNE